MKKTLRGHVAQLTGQPHEQLALSIPTLRLTHSPRWNRAVGAHSSAAPALLCPAPSNAQPCSQQCTVLLPANRMHLQTSVSPTQGGPSLQTLTLTWLLGSEGGAVRGSSALGTKQALLLLGGPTASPPTPGWSAQTRVIAFQTDAIRHSIAEPMHRVARATGTLGLTCWHPKA